MTIFHVTEATGGLPNSGRLSGTDGDLVGIMDVALPLNSWAIQNTSGTDRTYRSGTGNRFPLGMRDASAVTGTAQVTLSRGMESAVSASSWTDPFPTVAELSDSQVNWIKSSTSNTTARNFDIYIGTTWVFYAVNFGGTANVWDWNFYGDMAAALTGDPYNTIHIHSSSQSGAVNAGGVSNGSASNANLRINWCRSFDGVTKSTFGASSPPGSVSNFGLIASTAAAKAGVTTGVERQKTTITDGGGTTTAFVAGKVLPVRGYLPNLWWPLHSGAGTMNTRDTFTDTSYNPSATFKVFCGSASGGFVIVEETDTWSPPAG